jgi:hypothetical protein
MDYRDNPPPAAKVVPHCAPIPVPNSKPIDTVALALNARPRKTLAWKTPAEAFDEYLRLAHTAVATTN